MPDGPFKFMGRERNSLSHPESRFAEILMGDHMWGGRARCDKCGALLQPGDWPFCTGRPEDHDR